MKNLQKFICLLALLVGINSLSAQGQYTFVFKNRSFMGTDYLKVVFPTSAHNVCNATYSLQTWDEAEYTALTKANCYSEDNNVYTMDLNTPQKKTYSVKYTSATGFLISGLGELDAQDVPFGLESALFSGKNTVYIMMADIYTHLTLTIPAYELDEEIFVFDSEEKRKEFMTNYIAVMVGKLPEYKFTATPQLSLEDDVLKGKLSVNKDGKLVVGLNYKGKALSLVIDRSE